MNAARSALKLVKFGVFILLGLSWMAGSVRAQSDWQKRLEDLEKRQAKDTVALDKRLISDLGGQIKRAVRDGNLELANVLNGRKNELEKEVETLKKGAEAASARKEATNRRFARGLEGKIWSLENTTNVKAIAVEDAKVFAVTPDGRMTGAPQADKQALLRLFFGPRNDGDMSYYVFSPDLKKVLGLTSGRHTELTEKTK